MKIAIYARVSTEKQEKQETIQSQLQALRDFSAKNNHVIYEEYIDEGYSGELLGRPALDKLRDSAKQKLVEAVLIHSPDRLSRKFINLILIQEELKKQGIGIIFLNRPDSKDTPEDNLLNGVQGLIAEYEKSKILERTRRGRIHKAQKGLVVTSMAPYGYRYIRMNRETGAEGHYEINDEEAKVVKKIFDLFVNKRISMRAISRWLTNAGINPQRGKLWRSSSLHRIIRNETYAGITYYNKHYSCEPMKSKESNGYKRSKNTSRRLRPKSEWFAIKLSETLKIIDRSLFERAQRQLKINSALSPRNVKHQYLLRGLVECAKCNSPFFGTPCHGKLFYRCGNRSRTFPLPRECRAKMISAPKLENAVWDEVCNVLKNPDIIIKQIQRKQERILKGKKTLEESLADIDKKLDHITEEEGRLLDAYRANIINLEQLKSQMAKIQEKKDNLTKDKEGINEKLAQGLPKGLIRRDIGYYCKVVSKRLNSANYEQKQHIIRIVKRVVLDDNKVKIRGVIPQRIPARSIAPTPSAHCGCRPQPPQGRVLRVPGP